MNLIEKDAVMRAHCPQQITGPAATTEVANPISGDFASPSGQPDSRWNLRNCLASAVLLAVIGFRLMAPAQVQSTAGIRDRGDAIQTADWIEDLLDIIRGGNPPPPPPADTGSTNP